MTACPEKTGPQETRMYKSNHGTIEVPQEVPPYGISAAKKYHIWTIGCQMNVADSSHVAAELEKIGYGPTDILDDADVVILNTCVVRQSAEDRAIGKLGSLKPWRHARPEGTLALMGCMVGVKPSQKLMETYPHVDVFMSPSEVSPLISHLRQQQIDVRTIGDTRCKTKSGPLELPSLFSILPSAVSLL
jgi:tRNA A37 methylthiotransferase MiaB